MELSLEELNLVRQWFNATDDCAPKYLEDADRVLMKKVLAALAVENVAKAQAEGPTRQWEHESPKDWNANAAKFVTLVQTCPHMWLMLSRAKYIELRIDTRDGGFNLYDRDRIHLSPDDVVAAVERTNKVFGEAPHYRSAKSATNS